MNPQTIVYLGEGASMQMETVQIRGVDSTKRYTKFVCEAGSRGRRDRAPADPRRPDRRRARWRSMLNGKDARGRVISRSVAQDRSEQLFYPQHGRQRRVLRPCPVRQHHHGRCARFRSIPEIAANCPDAQLIHEAAIGKIAGDQTAQARDAGPVARGGGGHDSEGVPRLTIAKKELADTVCQLFFCEGVSLRTAHTETKGFRMRS